LLEDYEKSLDLYDKSIKINPKDALLDGVTKVQLLIN
jgi:hypothetical protein